MVILLWLYDFVILWFLPLELYDFTTLWVYRHGYTILLFYGFYH